MDSVFEKLKIPTFFKDILYLLAVTLFSRLVVYISSAVECIGDSLRSISKYFLNHRVVFVIANVIVVALFLLSRQHDDEKTSDNEAVSKDSKEPAVSYGEDLKVPEITEVLEKNDTEFLKWMAPEKSAGFEELQVVQPNRSVYQRNKKSDKGSKNLEETIVNRRLETGRRIMQHCSDIDEAMRQLNNFQKNHFQNNKWNFEETTVDDQRLEAERRIKQHSSEIDEAKRQLNNFQKNHSEKLKRAISIGPDPKLRPSHANGSPMLFKSEQGWQTVQVDALSNDEFRLVVETFIKQQQRLIMSEETDNFLLDSNVQYRN